MKSGGMLPLNGSSERVVSWVASAESTRTKSSLRSIENTKRATKRSIVNAKRRQPRRHRVTRMTGNQQDDLDLVHCDTSEVTSDFTGDMDEQLEGSAPVQEVRVDRVLGKKGERIMRSAEEAISAGTYSTECLGEFLPLFQASSDTPEGGKGGPLFMDGIRQNLLNKLLPWVCAAETFDRFTFSDLLIMLSCKDLDYDNAISSDAVNVASAHLVSISVALSKEDPDEVENAVLRPIQEAIERGFQNCGVDLSWCPKNLTGLLQAGAKVIDLYKDDEIILQIAMDCFIDMADMILSVKPFAAKLIKKKDPIILFALEYSRNAKIIGSILAGINQSDCPEWLLYKGHSEGADIEPPIMILLQRIADAHQETCNLQERNQILESFLRFDDQRKAFVQWINTCFSPAGVLESKRKALTIVITAVKHHKESQALHKMVLELVESGALKHLQSFLLSQTMDPQGLRLENMLVDGIQLTLLDSALENHCESDEPPPIVDISPTNYEEDVEDEDFDDDCFDDIAAPLPDESCRVNSSKINAQTAPSPPSPNAKSSSLKRFRWNSDLSTPPMKLFVCATIISSNDSPNSHFIQKPSESTQNESLWAHSIHEKFIDTAHGQKILDTAAYAFEKKGTQAFQAGSFDSFMDQRDDSDMGEEIVSEVELRVTLNGIEVNQIKVRSNDRASFEIELNDGSEIIGISLNQVAMTKVAISVGANQQDTHSTCQLSCLLDESDDVKLTWDLLLHLASTDIIPNLPQKICAVLERLYESSASSSETMFHIIALALEISHSQNRNDEDSHSGFFEDIWRKFCAPNFFKGPTWEWDWDLCDDFGHSEELRKHTNPCTANVNMISESNTISSDWTDEMKLHIVELAFKAAKNFQPLTERMLREDGENSEALLYLSILGGANLEESEFLSDCLMKDPVAARHSLLLWLFLFQSKLKEAREKRQTSICENMIGRLLRMSTNKNVSPGIRLVAAGICGYLVRRDPQHFSSLIGSNLPNFVAGSILPDRPAALRVGYLICVEYILRKTKAKTLTGETFDSLCNLPSGHHLLTNNWFVCVVFSILLLSCQGAESEEKLHQMTKSILSSSVWSVFSNHFEDFEDLVRSRVLQNLVLVENRIPAFKDWITSQDIESEVFQVLASKILSFSKEEKTRELLFPTINESLSEPGQSDIAAELFVEMMSISHTDAEFIDETFATLLSSNQSAALFLVELFSSANQAGSLKQYVFAYFPVLLIALQNATTKMEGSWLARVFEELAPVAAATHKHKYLSMNIPQTTELCDDQGNKCSSTLDRTLGLIGKKEFSQLSLAGGGISSIDILPLLPTLIKYRVKELDLSKNMLGDDGAMTVASWLTEDSGLDLEELSLSGNHIGPSGLKSLSAALKCKSSHLKKLDLSENNITENGEDVTGLLLLTETLLWNTTLEELDLCATGLTAETVSLLTRGLRYNGSLKLLWLDGNENSVNTLMQRDAIFAKLNLNQDGIMQSPHIQTRSMKSLGDKGMDTLLEKKARIRQTTELFSKIAVKRSMPPLNTTTLHNTAPLGNGLRDYSFSKTIQRTLKRADAEFDREGYHFEEEDKSNNDDGSEEEFKAQGLAKEIQKLHENIMELLEKEHTVLESTYVILGESKDSYN